MKSDDLMTYIVSASLASIVAVVKIVIGVMSVPVVVLTWLYDLGCRTIDAANAFKNPQP